MCNKNINKFEDGNITILYSDNWIKKENYMGSVVVFWGSDKWCEELEGEKPSISVMQYSNLNPLMSFRKIYIQTKLELKNMLDKFEIIGEKIEGENIEFRYQGINRNNGKEMEFIQRIVKLNSQIYSVTAGCSKITFPFVKNDMSELIDTIKCRKGE